MTINRPKSKLEQVLDIIQKEPNYEVFDYKGYHCVILRMMYLGGQLNGYVRIPEGHPYYDKGYDDMPIDCHGGPTFAGELEDEGAGFYVGFDTAHYQDYMPFLELQFKNQQIRSPVEREGTYKDINFVRNECKRIVDQLRLVQ